MWLFLAVVGEVVGVQGGAEIVGVVAAERPLSLLPPLFLPGGEEGGLVGGSPDDDAWL